MGTTVDVEGAPPAARRMPVRKVLVVDDNRDAADMLAALLKEMGQSVRCAYEGQTALLLCAQFRPDVIFVDFVMPQMDGLELALRMRDMSGLAARIIGVTGHGGDDLRALTSADAFDAHLVKPVSAETIRAVLSVE